MKRLLGAKVKIRSHTILDPVVLLEPRLDHRTRYEIVVPSLDTHVTLPTYLASPRPLVLVEARRGHMVVRSIAHVRSRNQRYALSSRSIRRPGAVVVVVVVVVVGLQGRPATDWTSVVRSRRDAVRDARTTAANHVRRVEPMRATFLTQFVSAREENAIR